MKAGERNMNECDRCGRRGLDRQVPVITSDYDFSKLI